MRIRVAIVRRHQAASIAERTARVPRIVRLSRATVITRNAPSKNLKHSSGNDYGGRCEEFERVMVEAAREHWDIIHRYREALASEQDRPAAEDLLRTSKAAMGEAEQRYHAHLATAHSH